MLFRSFLLVTLGLLSTSTSTYAHHGDGKKLNDVNNEVTVKLLQTLTEDDNALFSSALLSSELLLLANGVSGPAKDELLKAVGLKDQDDLTHVNLDAKEVWTHRAHLLSNKPRSSTTVTTDKTTFDLLPKLLLATDKEVRESFKALASDAYPTDVYKLATPLSEATGRAEAKKVNQWFSEKSTSALLGRLLDDGALTGDVKLLAVGGAAFKGAWSGEPFLKADTKEEDFKNGDGKSVKIAFMKAVAGKAFRVNKDETEKLTTVEVPFTEHDDADGHRHAAKLVLVLPTGDNTVDRAVDSLTADKLAALLKKVSEAEKVKPEQFKLPKLNFEKEYELKDALSELNVKGAFDASVANFSDLLQMSDLTRPNLVLNQLNHKAIVQWSEEADKVADTTDAAVTKTEGPLLFNRPFLFFITDGPKVGGADKPLVVFAGRIKTLSRDTTFAIV